MVTVKLSHQKEGQTDAQKAFTSSVFVINQNTVPLGFVTEEENLEAGRRQGAERIRVAQHLRATKGHSRVQAEWLEAGGLVSGPLSASLCSSHHHHLHEHQGRWNPKSPKSTVLWG